MIKVKNYKSFLETYDIDDHDPVDISMKKVDFNKKEEWIKEYKSKSSVLDNIYLSYVDQEDLANKLKSNKLIDDSKEISFINPLIGIRAQISQKNRKLQDIRKNIKILEDDIKSKEDLVNNDATLRNSLGEDITNIKQKISENNNEINIIHKEVTDLEKHIHTKLKEFEDSISDTNKNISEYKNKKTTQK